VTYRSRKELKKNSGIATKSQCGAIKCASLSQFLSKSLVVIFTLIVILGSYTPVYAGFFSLVSEILGGSAKASSKPIINMAKNSQTMSLLFAALNTDPNPNKGEQDISIIDKVALLASAGPAGTLADIETRKPQSDQISIYVVRPGDTLSQIAEMFNVTANTIKWANDIARGEIIQPGQTLIILPISGIRHSIKTGDTINSIAKKYGGNIEEILLYNNQAEDSALVVGEIIVIPDGELSTPTYSTPAPSKTYVQNSTNKTSENILFLRPIDGGTRSQGLHGYNGVDLAAPVGTPIYASADGEVIISKGAGWNGGYGSYIVIKHGSGVQTLYAHNSKNIVSSGDRVSKGDVIGYIGATGKATGPHVHFEIRGARNPF
jgi:LysM repeat protein